MRDEQTGQLDGENVPTDLATNAESLGALCVAARRQRGLMRAIEEARSVDRTTVIAVEVDREVRVPGYESWWMCRLPRFRRWKRCRRRERMLR